MRGADTFTESMFTLRKLEGFLTARHPLREVREAANAALEKPDLIFTAEYAAEIKGGWLSIEPAKLPSGAASGPLPRSHLVAADGAGALQTVVSLVHWSVYGRCGRDADNVQREPRA